MSAFPVPDHVRPFVEVLGPRATAEFLLKFGGAAIYFAASPKSRSAVAGMLGAEKAAALAMRLGPGEVYVPTAKPFIAHVLKADGLSGAAIARRLHVTEDTVRSYLGQVDRDLLDRRQLDLFA